MSKRRIDWVVAGGRPGELGHCQRCGEGLTINSPQRLEVMVAAMKAFSRAHAGCRPGQYQEPVPTIETWPQSRDTGISSATIFYVFRGFTVYEGFGVPHDPNDFGGCHRLLKLAPCWESRLQLVADRFPAWQPFVREWPRLKAMYESALQSGDGRPMYEFMRELQSKDNP